MKYCNFLHLKYPVEMNLFWSKSSFYIFPLKMLYFVAAVISTLYKAKKDDCQRITKEALKTWDRLSFSVERSKNTEKHQLPASKRVSNSWIWLRPRFCINGGNELMINSSMEEFVWRTLDEYKFPISLSFPVHTNNRIWKKHKPRHQSKQIERSVHCTQR